MSPSDQHDVMPHGEMHDQHRESQVHAREASRRKAGSVGCVCLCFCVCVWVGVCVSVLSGDHSFDSLGQGLRPMHVCLGAVCVCVCGVCVCVSRFVLPTDAIVAMLYTPMRDRVRMLVPPRPGAAVHHKPTQLVGSWFLLVSVALFWQYKVGLRRQQRR